MNSNFDIAIIGSGFGGSLLAMVTRRLGHSVVLLEKRTHPRFAIGESSTPLANLLLEEIAARYDLPNIASLSKWGTWQREHAEIGCGLKRGFTFHHHTFGQPFAWHDGHADQLMVAASPHNGIADTHWYRPDFDHYFVREAQRLGAEYVDEVQLSAPAVADGDVTLTAERRGEPISVRARFIADATGPRRYLHRALHLGETPLPHLPATQALFTHFRGVRRLDEMGVAPPDTATPYPIDDAAMHHVFDGGWIWVLRFNNGTVSAGVAATDALAQELYFAEGAPAWQRLLDRLPTVREQFRDAQPEFDFVHAPRLSFCSDAIVGERWAMLPSAAGFIDPLLSTGFPLTLLGITRLADVIAGHWESPEFTTQLQRYAVQTRAEILATEHLVAALYVSMADFELFTALSLLYFAAASYSETARRLGRPHLAGGFLMHDQPGFGAATRACADAAILQPQGKTRDALIAQVYRAIEPFDVAGLGDRARRNWYPVVADDLYRAAPKVEATATDIDRLLERCGFTAL